MEVLFSILVGLMIACGLFLMLRARTFPVVLGMTLFSYAANLFLFAMGRLPRRASGIVDDGLEMIDPIPQALVLTAIVIGFAMTAFVIILAIRARGDLGSDHVNGRRRGERMDMSLHSAEPQGDRTS